MKIQAIKAYKAFDKDLKCLDFQYSVGKTYSCPEDIKLCEKGFHFCENPLNVLHYYNLINSRFAIVEIQGKVFQQEEKGCTDKIRIERELSLSELIAEAIKYNSQGNRTNHASSGDWTNHASSGYRNNHASSGDWNNHASSGDWTNHASSGDRTNHASSGYGNNHASSGDWNNHASSGDWTNHASSGYGNNHASSGDGNNHASSGDGTRHKVLGNNCVVACSGKNSKVKGISGTWVALAEYNLVGNCIGFVTGCIGQGGLKEDTWYEAEGGKFVEIVY
jgi:hypothetical protein